MVMMFWIIMVLLSGCSIIGIVGGQVQIFLLRLYFLPLVSTMYDLGAWWCSMTFAGIQFLVPGNGAMYTGSPGIKTGCSFPAF